jgi:hypothetical protein
MPRRPTPGRTADRARFNTAESILNFDADNERIDNKASPGEWIWVASSRNLRVEFDLTIEPSRRLSDSLSKLRIGGTLCQTKKSRPVVSICTNLFARPRGMTV